MSDDSTEVRRLQPYLERLCAGELAARGELISAASEPLREIARKMLRRFPRVQRWEDSDDVLQNVMIRLMRTLEQLHPATVRDFLRLASLQTRRELLDMVKHYYGPQGMGRHQDTQHPDSEGRPRHDEPEAGPSSFDPAQLAVWTEFHEQVDRLPDEEREVFHLHWYMGLPQEEVAAITRTSVRTVKRRWQSARLRLYDALQGRLPDDGGPFP